MAEPDRTSREHVTAPRSRRPLLRPGVLALARGDDEVQVGAPRGRAVVLKGVPADGAHTLRRLDGSRTRDDLGGVPDWIAPALDLLDDAGLLADAAEPDPLSALPPFDRQRLAPEAAVADLLPPDALPGAGRATVVERRRARVDVVGGVGRLGTAVAALLGAAGVGGVRLPSSSPVVVSPADLGACGPDVAYLGAAADAATQAAVRRAGGSVGAPDGPPDLAVLCGPVAPPVTDALLGAGIAHLLVCADGPAAVVGPLVVPGAGPCCRCLQLHRTDRDPAWPRLQSQLVGRAPGPVDGVLATLAAGFTVLQALAHLDHRAEPARSAVGTSWELRLDDLVWRRRSWPRHPGCGCGWDDIHRATPVTVPRVTMGPPTRAEGPRPGSTGRPGEEP